MGVVSVRGSDTLLANARCVGDGPYSLLVVAWFERLDPQTGDWVETNDRVACSMPGVAGVAYSSCIVGKEYPGPMLEGSRRGCVEIVAPDPQGPECRQSPIFP